MEVCKFSYFQPCLRLPRRLCFCFSLSVTMKIWARRQFKKQLVWCREWSAPIYEFLSVWVVVEDRSFSHSMLWISCVTGFFWAWYIWGGTVSLGFDILFFIWVRKIWYWYTECLLQGSDIFSTPWWGTCTLVPPPSCMLAIQCAYVSHCWSVLHLVLGFVTDD